MTVHKTSFAMSSVNDECCRCMAPHVHLRFERHSMHSFTCSINRSMHCLQVQSTDRHCFRKSCFTHAGVDGKDEYFVEQRAKSMFASPGRVDGRISPSRRLRRRCRLVSIVKTALYSCGGGGDAAAHRETTYVDARWRHLSAP
jgi:hypothetical protein